MKNNTRPFGIQFLEVPASALAEVAGGCASSQKPPFVTTQAISAPTAKRPTPDAF